ncbi:glycosyltransferase family 4 protein [Chromobacterium violaceum]|uniref:glycosyltransferase family 4 protein n=1 Tax=Chromobacterium violaceum TaxID=536 RepID=UPI001B3436BB|nr:glycosyltransferase family 4 protein [Chromobacterium violaceum]MBP4046233.1 glycosyltransferase family 4 protein [Chromobacterium violaceum]
MKIAIIIYSMAGGGAERVSSLLSNEWANQGHEVSIITFTGQELDAYALSAAISRISIAGNVVNNSRLGFIFNNVSRLFRLRKVLKELKPDVAIGMMTASAVTTLVATLGMKTKILVSERTHPPLSPVGRAWTILRKYLYARAHKVVVQSKETLAWLNKEIPAACGALIPNPVLIPLPQTTPIVCIDEIVAEGRKVVLAVGRMDRQKQFHCLIQAFSQLATLYPDWDLIILGQGEQRHALQELIQENKLEHRIKMPGRAGNMADWYMRAQLYVMSSSVEGFPNTLIEAMAHGCPVISYDCDTGPRDIIRNGLDGLLVSPVGDINQLKFSIESMMENDELRNKMGKRAMEVRERFSYQKVVAMWERQFLENTKG